MKRLLATKLVRMMVLTLALVGLLAACQPCTTFLEAAPGAPFERPSKDRACSTNPHASELPGRAGRGCSVFTVAKGDRVFFGGNDDYIEPDSYYWVEPGQGDDYGVVWIGTPDNVQQGVNEMGLAYDSNGLPEVEMNPHRERIPWSGHMGSVQMHILHECATVQEAIEWVQTHQVWPRMNDQRQYADASGDAVLISPGPDGELVFTRKPRGDGYLVSTNFNVINPEHSYGYPCWRYDTAQHLLRARVERGGALTAQDAAGVLNAVHVENGNSWTIESLVADLPNRVIYLYFFHQFDKPVVLNVADELAHPRAPGPLSALFPEDVRQEAARRYAVIQAGANRCRRVGMGWIASVLACVVLLVVLSPGGRPGRVEPTGMHFWIILVLVLGPLGFLVWWVVGRSKAPPPRPSPADPKPSAGEGEEGRVLKGVASSSAGFAGEGEEESARAGGPAFLPPGPAGGTEGGQRWRAVLLEAAGDVTPAVVAFAIYLALAVKFPAVAGEGALPLVFIAGLPLALSWLAFQGPLLALAGKRSYLRTLWKRLPHALVAGNLGMAGVVALAGPLAFTRTGACSLFPSPGWSLGTLWAIVAFGSLPGGLLLVLYQLWAVKRGLVAWRAAGWDDKPVRSAAWRKLWWWVLLSYVVLLGGLWVFVVLLQSL